MNLTLIEKLKKLPQYWSGRRCEYMYRVADLRSLIEQAKAEQNIHPDFNLEYTCKRIRRLLRLLNIPDPSPDKDDVLMACLFSLLGTACGIIERTQAKAEKPEPFGYLLAINGELVFRKTITETEALIYSSMPVHCGDMMPVPSTAITPPDQSARIAELESQRDRLLAELKLYFDAVGNITSSNAGELIKEIEASK